MVEPRSRRILGKALPIAVTGLALAAFAVWRPLRAQEPARTLPSPETSKDTPPTASKPVDSGVPKEQDSPPSPVGDLERVAPKISQGAPEALDPVAPTPPQRTSSDAPAARSSPQGVNVDELEKGVREEQAKTRQRVIDAINGLQSRAAELRDQLTRTEADLKRAEALLGAIDAPKTTTVRVMPASDRASAEYTNPERVAPLPPDAEPADLQPIKPADAPSPAPRQPHPADEPQPAADVVSDAPPAKAIAPATELNPAPAPPAEEKLDRVLKAVEALRGELDALKREVETLKGPTKK